MNPNAAICQYLNGLAHVHRISAEAIEFCHDQHVAFFHLEEQLSETRPLIGADTTGNAFRNDTAFVYRESGCFDFAELVRRCLVRRADTGVRESSGHVPHLTCSKWVYES
ncbi:Uncharacterised protein [Burkholderia pseudomallei]|nr:Uncharacterised protein [Burkholderia pseudomallei]CAJ3350239.1 Uncharacterised protein [Burkholderia pseudomallei]CAJ3361481.1 Uncharacterised protein [Burkholderia pseudomallei]CAJ3668945.1 Uncharacterised protein [Burkholderia pseudomallei]CAJ4702614.1 Uncharacterised protein [Burkholderia pseudomallei]